MTEPVYDITYGPREETRYTIVSASFVTDPELDALWEAMVQP